MGCGYPNSGVTRELANNVGKIKALKPAIVVPGHFLDNAPQTLESVTFTQNYLTTLNAEIPKAKILLS